MEDRGMAFRETLLKQIRKYLDGEITKEEYYSISESFYSEYANTYENPLFHKCFMGTVADACLFYIDESGLPPEKREELFYQSLSEAYSELQKL